MKKPKQLLKALTISLSVLTLFPAQAFAYLDPGTGSYILQLLVGALLGGVFAIKAFWKNIRSFLGNFTKTKKG